MDKPRTPASDEHREKLLAQQRLYEFISSMIMLTAGLLLIISPFIVRNTAVNPETLYLALTAPLVVAVLLMYLGSFKLAKYNLAPKDEYEEINNLRSKAHAYDSIVVLLVLAILISRYIDRLALIGIILIAIGMSKFMIWKSSRNI